ncbi:fibropellin-1-like isoform X2 [Ruditapes philippinarum]|uniref:fibropellin-1-like isoform X2 n=1 Tax=Ruditapes philippinarum TaxID=129788 RepID=UPI00295B58E2|nr:fibropellin-1-like isoform X2 [Ruditapes philippinarum]
MAYISATNSIFLLSLCVFLIERTNGHMLGIDKDEGILRDKRFILTSNSKQSWTTLEQFSSCALTCVPGFEKLTQVCCDTGLNALCSNLPWTLLKAKLGTCVDLTPYGITTTAWSSLEQFAACFLSCVPGFEKLTEVCCQTGLDAVCTNLPWDSLKTSLGQCHAISPCSSNPCVHGTCHQNSNSFHCTCSSGYIGALCDKPDSCSSSPCVHGVCTELTNGTFHCTCSSGFTGLLCDKAISPCSSNPCVHGACHQKSHTFQCTCFQGYIGASCDKPDPCSPSPCVHGVCSTLTNGTFKCTCSSGFTGLLCDQAISPCSSNPCVHGTCHQHKHNFQCACSPGYTGTSCDKLIKDCKDVQDNHVTSQTGGGVYSVKINGQLTNVMCDMVTSGGGWTVIMNRENNNQNFEDQSFSSYADGFGDIRNNFWAGLEKMNGLTKDGRRYQLRVELGLANGSKYFAMYDDFSVGPPKDFVLHLGRYVGNAGDSLSGHNGFGFTNKDVDRDSSSVNCGVYLHGAWWFHSCYDSCLTCPYETPGSNNCRSFSWNSLAYCIALKSARMMVRPM